MDDQDNIVEQLNAASDSQDTAFRRLMRSAAGEIKRLQRIEDASLSADPINAALKAGWMDGAEAMNASIQSISVRGMGDKQRVCDEMLECVKKISAEVFSNMRISWPDRSMDNHDTLSALRSANDKRQKEWQGAEAIDTTFRGLEVASEVGELLEALKKYIRHRDSTGGSTATIDDIRDEMGDAIIAIDLLASDLGIDLGRAIVDKFNKTSEKYGLSTKIEDAQNAAD